MVRVKISEFLSTPDELHAFVVGFFETLAIFPPWHKMTDCYHQMILNEYHYYALGRAAGIPFPLALLYLIYRLINGG